MNIDEIGVKNKLEIKLANGHKLVAELCEYGGEIPPEITVYIQDEEGIALQDIVLVRAKEKQFQLLMILMLAQKFLFGQTKQLKTILISSRLMNIFSRRKDKQ